MNTENYAQGGIVGDDNRCTVWAPPHAGEQLITSQGEVYQWAVESASWRPTGERIDMAAMLSRFSAHVRGDDR
jgi:hypothetical protein